MKLYTVTFNDGKWHTGSLPTVNSVGEDAKEAIDNARIAHPEYKRYADAWAEETLLDDYNITLTKKDS